MNLLEHKWIPVRRRNDSVIYWIAPWELTSEIEDNPVVELAYRRPDFAGSIAQFLIGWLQTIVPELDDEDAWAELYDEPPTAEKLREWGHVWRPAFELDGNGPRFMQDRDQSISEGAEIGISGLLMDAPGGNTLKLNIDHFIKRGSVTHLSQELAAAALFSLQLNAPGGGQGHRTSMRGGGPLTTLVQADPGDANASLWQSLWLNVFDWETFSQIYDCEQVLEPTEDVFPWMGETRTSNPKQKGQVTTPDSVHPLQMYWSMPRRIRLGTDHADEGVCDLGGPQSSNVISAFHARNFGVNYEGAWSHPLSPYYFDKDGVGLPMHAQAGGMNYRHWLGLVVGEGDKRAPARIVHHALASNRLDGKQFRLWTFGFDMDNMKAVAWYESQFPLFPSLRHERQEQFDLTVEALIEAADLSRSYLLKGVKAAWFRRPGDKKGDMSAIDLSFWRHTEPKFYMQLDVLHGELNNHNSDTQVTREKIKNSWWKAVRNECIAEFDRWTVSGEFRQSDPKLIAVARGELRRSLFGKKLCQDVLGLPKNSEKS